MEKQKLEHFKMRLEEELALVENEMRDLGIKNPATGEWEASG